MSSIAIIPARSGSKGLKDKNIKDLLGIPLIGWSIKAAKESGVFDEIMVSTDSEKYRDIAISCGASVPFLRSAENASDKAGSWDVVREVLSKYEELGKKYDDFCLLQPTSPLRTGDDIKGAYKLFKEKNADSVVSLCDLEHSIDNFVRIPETLSLSGCDDSNKSGRRQDAEVYYRINGAIYIQKVSCLFNRDNIYGDRGYAYIMDKVRSVDIDDECDFVQAKALAEYLGL